MEKFSVTLKTITPLFLGGADPNEKAELRPPSIKGAMRFWWRAVKGMDEIKVLSEKENEIFGGTGKGEGKSKVTVRVMHKPLDEREKNFKNEYGLDCEWKKEKGRLEGKDVGICYLLYSTMLSDNKRGYIEDDFEFSVTLSSRDEDSLKQAIASFWVLVYLGGLGTRSRRGGGNLVVTHEPQCPIDDKLPDFVIKENDSGEVAEWLKANFEKCQKIICKDRPKDFATRYSNLAFSRFILCNKPKDSWQDSLNDIGKKFKDFREEVRKDPENIFKAGSFGLPIRHRNGITVTCRVDKENKDRRSSPLIIKTLKVNDKYYWLVLRLSGEFLPEGGVVYAPRKPNEKRPDKEEPDYTLIDDFWKELKKVAGKEFVLSTPEVIEKICKKIKGQSNPSKIILFGSRARGDAHKTADIDMAVENKGKAMYDDVYGPIDIVDMNRTSDNLKQRILKEGVEL